MVLFTRKLTGTEKNWNSFASLQPKTMRILLKFEETLTEFLEILNF